MPGLPGNSLPEEPGYLETLWKRKRDVIKLCTISLVVLLAISSHNTVWHYLREYLDTAVLTGTQDVILRVAYPAAVLVILWHTKAFLL